MIFCTSCGYEMPENANFCPKCGTKAEHKAQEVYDVLEYEEINDTGAEGNSLHYKKVWFVEGDRKISNSPWFTDLDIYTDHIEYKKKFTTGNVFTGGLGAMAVSAAKAKKYDMVHIPFSQIRNITFEKEKGIDGQKLVHIYMKDGGQFHFALMTINVKENEKLFQTIYALAEPYMN